MVKLSTNFSFLVSILLTSNYVQCFVARTGAIKSPKTNLYVSMPLMSEEEANESMLKARECALSDSCSVEDAKQYLNQVLYVQGACASGSLVGKDLCEGNQDVIAETVAMLRVKSDSAVSSQIASDPMVTVPLSMTLLCAFVIGMSTISTNPDVTPFTFQEWFWAVKGGYLDDMVSHYFRNGGL